jgi:hypothetical protein
MKKLIYSIAIIFVVNLNFTLAQQDIVNGDFEFWDTIPGTNGLEDPVGWRSNNYGIYNCTLGNYITGISKSLDSYSGSFSLKITPSNRPNGFWMNQTGITMTPGNCNFDNNCFSFFCDFSNSTHFYQKIIGYYKFVPYQFTNDTANLSLMLISQDSSNGSLNTTGVALHWFNQQNLWTYFEVGIDYILGVPQPTMLDLGFKIASNNVSTNPPGYLLIDSLALVPELITVLEKKPALNLKLSPNPVHDNLMINSSAAFKSFELCDLSGRIIKSGSFEKEMDVGFLSKGIYFVRLQSEKQIEVEKFVKE